MRGLEQFEDDDTKLRKMVVGPSLDRELLRVLLAKKAPEPGRKEARLQARVRLHDLWQVAYVDPAEL